MKKELTESDIWGGKVSDPSSEFEISFEDVDFDESINKEKFDQLISNLKTPSVYQYRFTEEKKAALKGLAELQDPIAVIPLITIMAKNLNRKNYSNAIMETLRQIGDKKVVDQIISVLNNKDIPISTLCTSVRILGKIRNARAVEPLIATLQSESNKRNKNTYKKVIIETLGEMRDKKAVNTLISVLTDNTNCMEVKRCAIKSLVKIGDKKAAEPIVKTLIRTRQLRNTAEQALRELNFQFPSLSKRLLSLSFVILMATFFTSLISSLFLVVLLVDYYLLKLLVDLLAKLFPKFLLYIPYIGATLLLFFTLWIFAIVGFVAVMTPIYHSVVIRQITYRLCIKMRCISKKLPHFALFANLFFSIILFIFLYYNFFKVHFRFSDFFAELILMLCYIMLYLFGGFAPEDEVKSMLPFSPKEF